MEMICPPSQSISMRKYHMCKSQFTMLYIFHIPTWAKNETRRNSWKNTAKFISIDPFCVSEFCVQFSQFALQRYTYVRTSSHPCIYINMNGEIRVKLVQLVAAYVDENRVLMLIVAYGYTYKNKATENEGMWSKNGIWLSN